jgi:hypothetical protein
MANGDDVSGALPWSERNVVQWLGRRFASYRLAASVEREWGLVLRGERNVTCHVSPSNITPYYKAKILKDSRARIILESGGLDNIIFMVMLGFGTSTEPYLLSSMNWYAIDLYRIIDELFNSHHLSFPLLFTRRSFNNLHLWCQNQFDCFGSVWLCCNCQQRFGSFPSLIH